MRLRLLLPLLFVVFGIFLVDAKAQSYGYSYIEPYHPAPAASTRIYAETGTVLDYNTWYYYDPGIQGYLYEDSSLIASTDRIMNYNGPTVLVYTYPDPEARYGSTYTLHGDHYLGSYYYYYSGGQPYYYDPFGYSFYSGSYPSPYSFLQGPAVYYTYQIYKVASTQVSIQATEPLHLSSIDTSGGAPGATFLTSLRGTGLFGTGNGQGASQTVQVSGSGVTATVQSTSPNTIEVLDVNIEIAPDAAVGERTLTLTVNGQTSNSIPFRIGDRTPQITNITPPEGNTGDQVPVTITGAGFGFNPILQIDGVGVSPTITSSSTTEITAIFSVAEATYIGTRGVKIVSRGISGNGFMQTPGNSDTSNAVGFTVFKPIVTVSEINLVPKGKTANVSVSVTNAKPNTYITFYLTTLSGTAGQAFFHGGSVSTFSVNIGSQGNYNGIIGIDGIMESSEVDKYQFKVDVNGTQPLTDKFTVYSLGFSDADGNPGCAGFDVTETPEYLYVPQNGTNHVNVTIAPTGLSNFNLSGLEQNGVTATPNSVGGGTTLVNVNAGSNIGTFTLQALENVSQNVANVLKIAVRSRINKTVVIHAVTEDNDDFQRLQVGNGEPNQIAIQPQTGARNVVSQQQGDDQKVSINGPNGRPITVINTGQNGVRQTPLLGNDVEIIPMNQGQSNSVCITSGRNLFRDTKKDPINNDDVAADAQGLEHIHSGPDGICQTTASQTDRVPNESSIPSVQSLQDYLNNTTWGRQANVFFTITKDPINHQVNFDSDRDGKFDGVRSVRTNEYQAIEDVARDPNANINLYYTGVQFALGGDVDDAHAEAVPPAASAFFSPDPVGSLNYVAAHEIGHILMPNVTINTVHSNDILDLMYKYDILASPCRIRKRDWDLL